MMYRPELLLGEEIMINVKKLRVLQRKGDEMERQKVLEKTRKYLASVGDRIQAVASNDRTCKRIWQVRRPSFFWPCPLHASLAVVRDFRFLFPGTVVSGLAGKSLLRASCPRFLGSTSHCRPA